MAFTDEEKAELERCIAGVAQFTFDTLILLAAAGGTAGVDPPDPPDPGPGGGDTDADYFAANSLWNTRLTGSEPLSPASAQIIADLRTAKGDTAQLQVSAGNGYGIPIFETVGGERRVTVKDENDWTMEGVPVPAGTQAASGEGYLIIVDRPANRVYNFFGFNDSGGATATSGGFGCFKLDGHGWWDYAKDPAHPGPWTGCSSNASYLGGVITRADMDLPAIPHGLCFTCDMGIQSQHPALPAKTTDGWLPEGQGWPYPGVPNGTRIRLRSNVNLSTLGLGPTTLKVAKALQDFGGTFIDRSYGISIRCQENANWGDIWSAGNQAGLTGKLFSYCDALAPVAAAEYDCPSTWSPPIPHQ
jgi:hypothetical protein